MRDEKGAWILQGGVTSGLGHPLPLRPGGVQTAARPHQGRLGREPLSWARTLRRSGGKGGVGAESERGDLPQAPLPGWDRTAGRRLARVHSESFLQKEAGHAHGLEHQRHG